MFSRNEFHYERNYREPFIPRGGALADFDSSSVYTMDAIVHGDRILTYYIGSNTRSPEVGFKLGDKAMEGIGLAISRLDGFVSLDSGKGWIDADPMTESSIDHVVSWNGESDLSALAGKSIKLRYYFKNSKLYSFQLK